MQAMLWWVAGAAGAVAGLAMLADRRRARRRDVDRVGWVPWHGLVILAIFVGAVSVALALRG